MIKLKNIEKNDGLMQCSIIPEDSKDAGHLIVDVTSGMIKEYTLPKGYEWCKKHINHAKDTLLKLYNAKETPKEKIVMWI